METKISTLSPDVSQLADKARKDAEAIDVLMRDAERARSQAKNMLQDLQSLEVRLCSSGWDFGRNSS
ncbi:unnamed protein product [Protopolystoma xenopodis]|uniref:Uncharacterized protein n=1 Tax=Protopolystoma xenopodis TaxID=117903 RepID=A0A3S5AWL3_9PLAT|nr:unnamed protein product [Protopolystoma xenopodis]